MRYPGIRYCFRESPLTMRDLWVAVWRPAFAALGAGIILFAANAWMRSAGVGLLAFVRDLTIFSAAYLACWVALPGGRGAVDQVTGLARDLRPARAAA
jgi:hypothetical protein